MPPLPNQVAADRAPAWRPDRDPEEERSGCPWHRVRSGPHCLVDGVRHPALEGSALLVIKSIGELKRYLEDQYTHVERRRLYGSHRRGDCEGAHGVRGGG